MNNLPKSILIKSQKKHFSKSNVLIDGEKIDITATVQYDDECGNGHNSFSITGEYYQAGKRHTDNNMISCGCIHEAIVQAFPELEPFIKWHLTSTDEPMHYVANTTYHARDTDTKGKKVGEVNATKKHLYFKGIPFSFAEHQKGFWEYLDSVGDFNNIEVEAVKYDGKASYNFGDNFSLTGFIKENEEKRWYKTPFKNFTDAREFLEALRAYNYDYVVTPCGWVKMVEPNLEAARSCAIWPDATLEQLQDEVALTERLPALMVEFKKDVESLGLTY